MNERTLERFMSHVDRQPDDCWIWTALVINSGYGKFWVRSDGGKRLWFAHRFAYTAFKGDIPEGFVIDHLCRRKTCVNPAHLEAVTQSENIRRGMSRSAVIARRGTCDQGHEIAGANVYEPNPGKRSCRECRNRRRRELKTERRAA